MSQDVSDYSAAMNSGKVPKMKALSDSDCEQIATYLSQSTSGGVGGLAIETPIAVVVFV